jgi:glycerol-3-phosphate dehydrogenase
MAKVAAAALDWDVARAEAEIDDVRTTLRDFHGQDLKRVD